MKTTETVDRLLRKTVEDMGYALEEVEYQKEPQGYVLTLYISNQAGITIDDCERVSRAVDPILDAADPIADSYYLSVSSLGLDRPIKTDRDFSRNLGKTVNVKLFAPKDGKKEFRGILTGFSGEGFSLETEKNGTLIFTRKEAAHIEPHIEF